ncbi:MAG: hypothetical protein FD174_4107 [Geobacteraceae bacterium]|nr:MAG: hypothetical protein FD174_4107 [Geobacteraceae bacterium]
MHIKSSRKKIAGCVVALVLIVSGAAWWGYAHLTDLVQAQLRIFAGNDLTIGKVTARWNRVELEQVRLARRGAGPFDRRITIGRVVLRPRLVSLFSGRLELAEISIDKPYLLLEIAPDGALVKPFPPGPAPSRKTAGPSHPVTIDAVHVTAGTVDILDWHVGRGKVMGLSNPRERYNLLHLHDVAFDLGKLDFPPEDRTTPLRLTLKNQGGGTLVLNGTMAPKTLDGKLTLAVTDLDITRFRPYFLKQGDLGVAAGTLSVRCDISIAKHYLKAPGVIVLKGLEFERSGAKGFWMGIPAWALVNVMADNKDELKMNFAVNGSLDNPRFTVRQSFVEQIAMALSSKIGVASVESIGKGIIGIGSKGVKGVMGIFGR